MALTRVQPEALAPLWGESKKENAGWVGGLKPARAQKAAERGGEEGSQKRGGAPTAGGILKFKQAQTKQDPSFLLRCTSGEGFAVALTRVQPEALAPQPYGAATLP